MSTRALIAGCGRTPYARSRDGETTLTLIARAVRRALGDAGFEARDLDGLGVASFSIAPDHAIDVAWRLGLDLRWLMDDPNGGASGLNMLQHAVTAVEAGEAEVIALVAGDLLTPADFAGLVDGYNSATRDHLASIPFGGPNALFALLTRRHMLAHELSREDYGRLVVAQHASAGGTLTLADYLGARMVADPLTRWDCVPIVSGAEAVVVAAAHRVRRKPAAAVRALVTAYNADQQEGDGLTTGLPADELWGRAGLRAGEMDVVQVYDDYPAMVFAQLADLGYGDPREVLAAIESGRLRVNTSGGQLANGQAGTAGGMLGLVEAVRRLRDDARTAVVTGYGMVVYRHGAMANAAVLRRVD